MSSKIQAQGFTLIEVLIAVAILAILAAIAIPSYVRYIERGHVTNAKAALIQIQSLIKKEMVVQPKFTDAEFQNWLGKAQNSVDKSVSDRYDITSSGKNIFATPKIDTGYRFSVRIDQFGNALFCKDVESVKSDPVDDNKCKASLGDL
ncbi:prepilin-type N-terminal cleavage/methylation domain-containing protein [Neisseria canis]|uniref:Pilin n=1 Tax=Neisseria canis TaxID=493 RepID=A0A448DBA0_9NEIS|nr:prepilin-type N-terminal cleavage/methylation domain-containing protein [Neisseria canis]VEF03588.1 pilin [Neisseria canis]